MRANTAVIHAHPTFQTYTAPNAQGKWGRISFPSMRAMHEFTKTHCRTTNESIWLNAEWAGLESQSVADFDNTGIAAHAENLLQTAKGKLPAINTRLAEPRASVTGGFWDTPSVLANIPLAARTRHRAKLKPLDLRIAFVMSASITAESLAPMTAKILRAIWDYTQAGGAVTLHIADVGKINASKFNCKGIACIAKINTTDVAEMSLALSPVMSRLIGGPIQNAFSERDKDTIGVPAKCPLEGYHWIGGSEHAVFTACEQVLKTLQIN